NSQYDAGDGDTLQSNVTVTLYDDANCNNVLDGSEASSAVTQSTVGGNYIFSNLTTGGPGTNNPPGCYIVEVDTTDTDLGVCNNPITTTPLTPDLNQTNPNSANNNFGHDTQLTLGDYVWYDSNQNGVQDANELGINGVTVNLYNNATCTGAPSQSTTTATGGLPVADGYYQFSPLPTGNYCVEFIAPSGNVFTQTGQGTSTTDSDANNLGQVPNINLQNSNQTIDAGLYVPGSIGGLVWCESPTNANSQYDAGDGDTLQSNVTVTLYDDANCNNVLDGSEASSAVTQSTVGGNYTFNNLLTGGPGANNPPGCYIVQVDTSDTDLGACNNPITTTPQTPHLNQNNPNSANNNFGHDSQLGVGDYVWYDSNQNGIQDAGEPGVNGITVNLYYNATWTGIPVQMTVTTNNGNDGYYQFSPLPAGDYCIEFSNLTTGWVFTSSNVGTDSSDSDADPTTGQIMNINLVNSDSSQDAGIYAAIGSVPGVMFCDDSPQNGSQDAGEEQANVAITLYSDTDCNGTGDTVYATQDTDANGQFNFTNLPVALSPAPPNPQVCYVVTVDSNDVDLGDCTTPILPEDSSVSLTTGSPDATNTIFGVSPNIIQQIPLNSWWSLMLLSLLLIVYTRRRYKLYH
ncbi:MAG TPA: hypothetical protein ENJ44_01675, partial [Oceanospirillales bacterium]|nr:hypothetical protein [Oceanospirillales bacterium]